MISQMAAMHHLRNPGSIVSYEIEIFRIFMKNKLKIMLSLAVIIAFAITACEPGQNSDSQRN